LKRGTSPKEEGKAEGKETRPWKRAKKKKAGGGQWGHSSEKRTGKLNKEAACQLKNRKKGGNVTTTKEEGVKRGVRS